MHRAVWIGNRNLDSAPLRYSYAFKCVFLLTEDSYIQEPGQARRASRPPSLLGSHLDLDPRIAQDFMSGSQRSAFFPWDNAGASSSVNGASFDFGRESSAKRSFGRADVGLRGSFLGSRPESPLNPGRPLDSPADFGTRNPQSGDNFVFEGW